MLLISNTWTHWIHHQTGFVKFVESIHTKFIFKQTEHSSRTEVAWSILSDAKFECIPISNTFNPNANMLLINANSINQLIIYMWFVAVDLVLLIFCCFPELFFLNVT